MDLWKAGYILIEHTIFGMKRSNIGCLNSGVAAPFNYQWNHVDMVHDVGKSSPVPHRIHVFEKKNNNPASDSAVSPVNHS